MTITLKHYTPLSVASEAIRTCWQSFDKSDDGGEKDRELIYRVGNKFKHNSTLEHLTYNFQIDGISRACLQELARHRMTNLSVKSSRYTLKELKAEPSVVNWDTYEVQNLEVAQKYLVFTENKATNFASTFALGQLQKILNDGVSNDIAKFCMPESYKTELAWTINARSLQNFLSLRTNKAALWEIRNLANEIFNNLPEDHKYLFEEFVYSEED